MRSASLFLLVLVDFVVAVLMVFTAARFVVSPDPAIKAGPMYVVLALTTGAALLIFLMALNASFVPLMTPMHARDVRLVMWTMAATGVVTGMLTLGTAVQGIVLRLFVAVLAFAFIRVQEARLERARRTGQLAQVAPAGPAKARHRSPRRGSGAAASKRLAGPAVRGAGRRFGGCGGNRTRVHGRPSGVSTGLAGAFGLARGPRVGRVPFASSDQSRVRSLGAARPHPSPLHDTASPGRGRAGCDVVT